LQTPSQYKFDQTPDKHVPQAERAKRVAAGLPADVTHDVQVCYQRIVRRRAKLVRHLQVCHTTKLAELVIIWQGLLRWDLGAMAAFTCVPSPGAPPVACLGPGDVSTCRPENGGSACKESDTKKTVAPFKVCYQAGEGVRPGVDVALWQRTFGRPPEERSCKVIPVF
jgi:hypothetical protein